MRRLRLELTVAALLLCAVASAGDKTAVVVLRWDPVPEAAKYELQIAESQRFEGLTLEATVDVAGYRWRSLPTQTFYWRVRSVDAEGRKGKWSVVKHIGPGVRTPVVERPSDKKVITCLERCIVDLAMRPEPLIDRYVIEWWPSGSESTPQKLETRSSAASVDVGPPGPYVIRVGAFDIEGRQVDPAAPITVELLARAPIPSFPAPGSTLELLAPGVVDFSWTANPGDSGFEVELKNGKGVSKKLTTDALNAELPLPANGDYSWRVRSRSSGYSAWSRFTALAPAPIPTEPVAAASFSTRGETKRVRFAWQATGRPSAVLELSADEAFTSPRVIPVVGESIELDVPVGGTHWRVAALDGAGLRSASSSPWSFEVRQGGGLAAPSIVAPSDGDYVPSAQAQLTWTRVPEAAVYEVSWAAGASDFQTPVPTSDLSHRLLLPQDGAYRARVRAIDSDHATSEWSDLRTFHRGVPPVAAAVVETPFAVYQADEVVIPVRFVDARGRQIDTRTAVVKVGAGEVQQVSARAYRYTAPANLPRDAEVELTIVDRDFTHRQTLRLKTRNRFVRFGAAFGYASNLGRVAGALTSADVTVRTPLLGSRVLGAMRLGRLTPLRPVPVGDGALSASVRATAVSLLGTFEQPLGRFSLYGGAGPQANFTEVSLGEASEARWSLGAQAVAGALTRLPVGMVRGELSYGVGQSRGELATLRTGLLSFTVGFAWEP